MVSNSEERSATFYLSRRCLKGPAIKWFVVGGSERTDILDTGYVTKGPGGGGTKLMICANCNTPNEAENVFCVNCGNAVTASAGASITSHPFSQSYVSSDSTETSVVNLLSRADAVLHPNPPYSRENKIKKTNPVIWIGVGLVAIVGLIAAGAFFPTRRPAAVKFSRTPWYVHASCSKDKNDEISLGLQK